MKNLSKKTIKVSVLILILSLIFSFTSCRKKAEDPYLVAIKKYNEVLDNISNYKFIPDDIKHQKDDDWEDYDLTLTGEYGYALLNIYNSNIPVMIVEAQVNHDHMTFQNNPVMVFAINPSNNEVVVSESFYNPNTPNGFGLTTIGNGFIYYYFQRMNGKGECFTLTFENGKFVKELVFDGIIGGEDLNEKDFEFFDIKNREPINRLSSKKNRYSGKLTEPKIDFRNIVDKQKKEGKKEYEIILSGKLEMYTKEEILKKYPDSKGVEAYYEKFEELKKLDPNFEFNFYFLKLNSPRKINVTYDSETKKEILVENVFLAPGVTGIVTAKKGMNAFIMADENDFGMTDDLFFAPDIPTVESDSLTIYK